MNTLRAHWDAMMAHCPADEDVGDLRVLRAMFYLGAAAVLDIIEAEQSAQNADPDARLEQLANEIQLESDQVNANYGAAITGPTELRDAP